MERDDGSGTGRPRVEVEVLVDRFEALSLPSEAWTHQAHLAVGLWYVATRGPDAALELLRSNIRRYNDSVGTPNSDTSGYHETITRFYVGVIDRYLRSAEVGSTMAELVEGLLTSPAGARDHPLLYFSRDRLFSVGARRGWIEPDLRPLPE